MSEHALDTVPPRRRRRWFSLSLRGMMIFVLVVGGFLGWKARRAGLQKRAVARIYAFGGSVNYDWEELDTPLPPGSGPAPIPEPPGPVWLRKFLGDQYFQEVLSVTLPRKERPTRPKRPGPDPDGSRALEVAEKNRLKKQAQEALYHDDLACLEGLDRTEWLTLNDVVALKSEGLARLGRLHRLKVLRMVQPLTDQGIDQVSGLTELEILGTSFQLKDDSALSLLERLPRLKSLSIDEGSRTTPPNLAQALKPDKIADAWLPRLGRLHQLEILHLNGSGISDAGLAHLKGLDQLKSLSLGEDSRKARSPLITDAGLAHLSGMKSLVGLDFASATEIGDAGLAHLVGLKNLVYLGLPQASRVTDAGLAHLAELDDLEGLDLHSASKVTEAGIAHLAKLPRLATLILNNQSLTDAGLARLETVKHLTWLNLTGPMVKGKILDRLQAANPGLGIDARRIEDGDRPRPNF